MLEVAKRDIYESVYNEFSQDERLNNVFEDKR